MSISFNCERCHKEVKAPDSAAGKRGRCPFCGESTYIPMPVSEDELLSLAPIDEKEEERRQQEVHDLLKQEKDLFLETAGGEGGEGNVPLEHRQKVSGEDLHHFVINYCLDMAGGKLDRAATYVPQLKKFGTAGLEAIDDFVSGKALEPALAAIPGRVLMGFLTDLRNRVRN